MKNKILSYLLGWLLAILLNLPYRYVHADCDCEAYRDDLDTYNYCVSECNKKQQQQQDKQEENKCNWIKLNTNFPIIWNCISTGNKTDATSVFPTMIWALTKIAMSLIFIVCFILVIVGGIMWAWDKPKEGQKLITKVAITILLLWFSGVILRLINPNFFG